MIFSSWHGYLPHFLSSCLSKSQEALNLAWWMHCPLRRSGQTSYCYHYLKRKSLRLRSMSSIVWWFERPLAGGAAEATSPCVRTCIVGFRLPLDKYKSLFIIRQLVASLQQQQPHFLACISNCTFFCLSVKLMYMYAQTGTTRTLLLLGFNWMLAKIEILLLDSLFLVDSSYERIGPNHVFYTSLFKCFPRFIKRYSNQANHLARKK